ncbi:ABC transporter permease [Arthrobacter sp. S13_S34]|nr:ABC transporter permease [Arthrobacter sp. S13_S34]
MSTSTRPRAVKNNAGTISKASATGFAGELGRNAGLGGLGLLIAVGLWWIFSHTAGQSNTLIQAFIPERVLPALWSLLDRGVLLPDAWASLRRLLAGMLVAAAAGIALGVVIGLSKVLDRLSSPVIQFLRMISPLSWAPVAVALFGVGDAPVFFLVAAAAIWPITISTAAGVRSIDQNHWKVAQTLGATRLEAVRTVLLPGIRTHVMTGLRLGLGIAWVVLVPAEMLGVNSGLGYEILNARDRLAYDEMLVVILTIGVLGIILDSLTKVLLRDRARH